MTGVVTTAALELCGTTDSLYLALAPPVVYHQCFYLIVAAKNCGAPVACLGLERAIMLEPWCPGGMHHPERATCECGSPKSLSAIFKTC